jgi:hypothetical protein
MKEFEDRAALLELVAHRQICDAVKRAARGADRVDAETFLSAFHPGAIDHHGYHTGTCEEHAEIMIARHKAEVLNSTHLLGSQLVEIDGDQAVCETNYFVVQVTERQGVVDQLMATGRYLDRLALRNGEWRIVERHVLIDWSNNENDPNGSKIIRGRRDRSDLSYSLLKAGLG